MIVDDNDNHLNDCHQAMLAHLESVQSEYGAATARDFIDFTVDGAHYSLKYGTIRNYLSTLVRKKKVKVLYKSSCAFYTTMTSTHTVVRGNDTRRINHRRDLAGLISRLTFGSPSAHDLHLRFSVPGIYARLSTSPLDKEDLPAIIMQLDTGLEGRITVHHGDTITVILGCTMLPITFNIDGILRLDSALTRVEERVRSLVGSPVPEYGSWIVTMWHLNLDTRETYSGEKFEAAWQAFTGEWIRVYTKRMKGRQVIRIERQEYPRSPLHEEVEHKLAAAFGSSTRLTEPVPISLLKSATPATCRTLTEKGVTVEVLACNYPHEISEMTGLDLPTATRLCVEATDLMIEQGRMREPEFRLAA